ncbi:hypothetical protein ES332_D08G241300v1 [Gossypium tomentosum]|uniref:Uncharacterized protein n=1 Tax=Gossypium tomentosum TaxID=34277 RepID=A0A5D2JZK2_GOSTO|nr:hypothetical protein ES332_D08G241300v1 [Gossypium tomentosum]
MSYTFFSVRHFSESDTFFSPFLFPLGCNSVPLPVWSRTNARVSVKDVSSTISGLSQNLMLYIQFSAYVKRGSKPSKEEEEKQNYYVNMVTLFRP